MLEKKDQIFVEKTAHRVRVSKYSSIIFFGISILILVYSKYKIDDVASIWNGNTNIAQQITVNSESEQDLKNMLVEQFEVSADLMSKYLWEKTRAAFTVFFFFACFFLGCLLLNKRLLRISNN